jgi:signal transduction histidine kinase
VSDLREATDVYCDLADERDRIARDLHDRVVQRLFVVGLRLADAVERPDMRDRVAVLVEEIDESIAELRSAIYHLQRPNGLGDVRRSLTRMVDEVVPILGHQPVLEMDGPLEQVGSELITEAGVVVRELLNNVLKHAGCSRTWVRVAVEQGWLTVMVSDDGNGARTLHPAQGGTGLRSLAERAQRNGGRFDVAARAPHGTVVRWAVPAGG